MMAAVWKRFRKVSGKEFVPSHHISGILDKGHTSQKAGPFFHDKLGNASDHRAEESLQFPKMDLLLTWNQQLGEKVKS